MGSLSDTPRPGICLVFRREESFSYTPRAEVCLVLKWVRRFCYTSPVGICFVVRREVSISYTPRASMCLVWGWWGVSLTRPVMESVCSFGLIIRRVGSFSYTPRAQICLFVHRVTRHILETVSLVGGWRVYVKRPVINSVWSFVG